MLLRVPDKFDYTGDYEKPPREEDIDGIPYWVQRIKLLDGSGFETQVFRLVEKIDRRTVRVDYAESERQVRVENVLRHRGYGEPFVIEVKSSQVPYNKNRKDMVIEAVGNSSGGLTEDDIMGVVGMKRPILSKVLEALRADGIVSYVNGRYTVNNSR